MSTSRKMHKVKGPDPRREAAVWYYEHAWAVCSKVWGVEPSRNTLYNWLVEGYPIVRGGPYVQMPVYYRHRRPATTREAMQRWAALVRKLERQHAPRPSLIAGGDACTPA